MLYYLFSYLERTFQPPGFQAFQFITVRAALAAMTALVIALFFGRNIIEWLEQKQLGERVREGEQAGAVSHTHKAGTPTMGGIIILLSITIATLLWGAIANPYVWLVLLSTVWMGAVGFTDDYIKTVKKNKNGLPPRSKIIAQVTLGLFVGTCLYFLPEFHAFRTYTSLPLVPDGRIDYFFFRDLAGGIDLGWVVYIPVVVFIITAVSNAVNITDGLDGLCTGVTAFVAAGILVLAYISGNAIWSGFLNEMYLPGAGELTIYAAAMSAACFGFLWYNGYPASVFMGDTGSLALGAGVAVSTLAIRKELLLPLLGAVYFMETLSVIIQTSYFKYTKRKTGTGKRVFRMAPLHHHYEAGGLHESKIVIRFYIITFVTIVAALLSLRIR
ncbi:MAG TPA: phospho-N-acetylmuramoyl-pentapeptide-transferase [Rhodothermales bacterium]|nr:phospho-N-acetylmuramoyl-pentapeptide-transferase [Rhodothermales bacterium]